ncbi:MAG: hypothetical protein JJE18_04615 [Eubacteriaceae bacterium]|nr:hypothetical protein [Eubacteriaceae bacterium]
MNIPKKIKIGWKEYKIEFKKTKRKLIEVANLRYGEIDYDKRIITLNDESDKENQKATLIHEMIHGISDMYKLNFEENTVEMLGDAVYTLIKDNPELFKK